RTVALERGGGCSRGSRRDDHRRHTIGPFRAVVPVRSHGSAGDGRGAFRASGATGATFGGRLAASVGISRHVGTGRYVVAIGERCSGRGAPGGPFTCESQAFRIVPDHGQIACTTTAAGRGGEGCARTCAGAGGSAAGGLSAVACAGIRTGA